MKESDLVYGIMSSLGLDEYSVSYLKYLLSPFGVTDSSIRTTLSRMLEKGILISEKEGKSAYYRFTEKGRRIGSNVSFSFNCYEWSNWDHSWWGYVYSIPSEDKNLRYKIRTKLEAFRFASLYPGCWIRPFHESEKIDEKILDLKSSDYGHLTKMEFRTELTNKRIGELWKTKSINEGFESGLKLLHKSFVQLHSADPAEAFRLKMATGNDIVQLLFRDPLLPRCFLPNDWKGEELRELFFDWEKTVNIIAELFWKNKDFVNERRKKGCYGKYDNKTDSGIVSSIKTPC